MYFETITHELVMVSNAREAAEGIKSKRFVHYQVPSWNHNGVQWFIVSDTHADDSAFGESAIIVHAHGHYIQVESFTIAWMKDIDQLVSDLENLYDETTWPIKKPVNLILDIIEGTEMAQFDCGCCGTRFKGNVKEQLEYGQDAGFGICDNCNHNYK